MYGKISSVNSINKVILLSKSRKYKKAKIVYCPPYTLLEKFNQKTKNSNIQVGAQNCHQISEYGAFTGSISPKLIKDVGSKYIILGHSENRKLGETNTLINLKIHSALKNNLNVILCIGETLKQKKLRKTNKVISQQLNNCLKKIKKINNIIIAYEPVWSIGSGIIPLNKDLQNIVFYIKKILNKKYKKQKVKLLYGGSVNPKNVQILNKITNLDGYLIGGASQKQNYFIDIIKKTIN
jgi:triosephosphate isomerase|tara:strand:- start:1095 stop:1808 length:714 start_codon:yes stop_codon:yes gene_type:complete